MSFSRPFHKPNEIPRIFSAGGPSETCLPGPRQLVMLDRNPLAALVSPGFQDQPATSRLHALAKPVGLCPMPVVRLVCSLWHSLVLLENLKC